ncbi:L-threonylcarbamoyladenylate synthase [Paenibacillus pasadenensis]|uniref:L-threonylcarbamoyladenylate synthase n=1 Tax=Paenibacillus pasadenensis TaxID=217090 RepID=UPI00203C6774|nr:L-threonylcarbamoyladenylate synthase [Paenibacillus pasadenensis]MCM3747612.1 L-threonylcarbamoyladenylate synthase [Paenibacillus pasadenensis]
MNVNQANNYHTRAWPDGPGQGLTEGDIREAGALLAAGGTVAFPTETVYGLGADARRTDAVEQVFAAKGRPSDNPLIVHIADLFQLEGLVSGLNETERRLAGLFWPGPFTMVLPAVPGAVSPRVTAGLDTVAVRMPDHELALSLIRAAGCPVAAPSANRSGRPSPTTARHVLDDLEGRIAGVVDGGPTGVGLESTVAECAGPGLVRILRPGGVTPEQLRAAGFEVELEAVDSLVATSPPQEPYPAAAASAVMRANEQLAPRSPGMKYAHYAPRGEMRLVAGPSAAVRSHIQAAADEAGRAGLRTGILAYDETAGGYSADIVLPCGSLERLETAAQSLYAVLREFDERGAEIIWAEACPPDGIGLALLNRLSKAAGGNIDRVG